MTGSVMTTSSGLLLVLLILMDTHVTIEIARLGETQLTELTLIGLLAAVHTHVLGERGRVREGLATVSTPKRLKNIKFMTNFLFYFYSKLILFIYFS